MALLTESEILGRADFSGGVLRKSAATVLVEEASAAEDERFDVFLSHSSSEPEDILLGVYRTLRDAGLNVYVDSYSDPHLDPDDVDLATARTLRHRLRSSASLLYVHSRHSSRSRWMPWELGFADAHCGRVGVIPVTQARENTFVGEEYLSLYPYVDRAVLQGTSRRTLWINRSTRRYAPLLEWVRGTESIRSRH
ncbi:toll/interleukin-1 receptor domain-containing protein [Novosphingopyxis baekryungensis]|jgi:hypothetical protein|uniref:toll/interleukin-1 receptor domain-containing protein n=1 Tax=Novosphingopyxis baekryungensis TaxID=279369 RepID=UPI0009FC1FEC|nr:toll/interleukin-1 receptor domain-containing protein [Novosphingopyxis baekryungensis]